MDVLNLRLEFFGGVESLFDMQKDLKISVPVSGCFSVSSLLQYIYEHLLVNKSAAPLLMDGRCETVRPGIVVLVNEVDWELLQGPKTILNDGDSVAFISTLHGG